MILRPLKWRAFLADAKRMEIRVAVPIDIIRDVSGRASGKLWEARNTKAMRVYDNRYASFVTTTNTTTPKNLYGFS